MHVHLKKSELFRWGELSRHISVLFNVDIIFTIFFYTWTYTLLQPYKNSFPLLFCLLFLVSLLCSYFYYVSLLIPRISKRRKNGEETSSLQNTKKKKRRVLTRIERGQLPRAKDELDSEDKLLKVSVFLCIRKKSAPSSNIVSLNSDSRFYVLSN